jgi:hypothetical protein
MSSLLSSVLISGAGQLGSRYLQGLARCRLPLRIYVQDPRKESLSRAAQRWKEVNGPTIEHHVSFHPTVESLPQEVDVAIVATTADVRPYVVGAIARHAAVRYWVLEKVLAQDEAGLDELLLHVGNSVGAWVNTPRRMMPWHQQMRSQLGLACPLTLRVDGGAWGLACNAVHFLDLCGWWTGETLQDVSTDGLDPRWFESKRPGFWEVTGTLEAQFSNGSTASMRAGYDVVSPSLEVGDCHRSWKINEAEGFARRSDGIELPGRMLYQTDMTAALVESILAGGCCDLPTMDDSVALHRVFLRRMLEHWTCAGHPGATLVPIT